LLRRAAGCAAVRAIPERGTGKFPVVSREFSGACSECARNCPPASAKCAHAAVLDRHRRRMPRNYGDFAGGVKANGRRDAAEPIYAGRQGDPAWRIASGCRRSHPLYGVPRIPFQAKPP
jgi:hypothetical protein